MLQVVPVIQTCTCNHGVVGHMTLHVVGRPIGRTARNSPRANVGTFPKTAAATAATTVVVATVNLSRSPETLGSAVKRFRATARSSAVNPDGQWLKRLLAHRVADTATWPLKGPLQSTVRAVRVS